MAIRMILLMLISCSAYADKSVYLFAENESDFVFGNVTEYAKDKGVNFVFYKTGERTKILQFLSDGLGGNEEIARKKLSEKIKNNQAILDRLVHAVEGEHKAIQNQINSKPAVLIDGRVFYTHKVDEALEALKE